MQKLTHLKRRYPLATTKKNCTTVDEIVSKNGIQDANKIFIGQKLTINETTEEPAEIPALDQHINRFYPK